MRDLSRDRGAPSAVNAMFAASLQRARALDARRAVQARPLIVDGAYDRSAIMSAAVAEAKAQRARGATESWRELVASALRFTWARAKAQRTDVRICRLGLNRAMERVAKRENPIRRCSLLPSNFKD